MVATRDLPVAIRPRVKMAEDNLLQLLEGYEKTHIEIGQTFMKQCLEAATLSDNPQCVGKLVKMGARNIDECLALSEKKGIVNSGTAMLLLMKAALTGDKTLLPLNPSFVRAASSSLEQEIKSCSNEHDIVTQAVRSGKMSTTDALEVAQRNGQHAVKRELLLSTNVNKESGIVDWSKLRLCSLDVQLLRNLCDWVRKLDLSANMLTGVPKEVHLLSKMISVDFSNNELADITAGLLQLPNLRVLNLSHNKLTHLPDIPLWSAALTHVDLSNNLLTSMPMNITASALTSFNLSKNRLSEVPLCVCTFTTLVSLDISYNPSINILPYEMSLLTKLKGLTLYGLNKLKYPTKSFAGSIHEFRTHLQTLLNSYAVGIDCVQLMIVGNSEYGKSVFTSRMFGKGFRYNNDIRVCVRNWEYRPNVTKRLFRFRTWIFKALEDYQSTHHCFLSQRSVYVLLFNLNDGCEGVYELKPWLKSISHQAPYSALIVVGMSHLDKADNIRDTDIIIQQAKMAVAAFANNLESLGIFTIEVKNLAQNVKSVLSSIHHCAVNFPFLEMAIIREVESNGDKVTELLRKATNTNTDSNMYLNRAMIAAAMNDNSLKVGELISHGATNISECLRYTKDTEKPHARAMLLLVKAAQTGDKAIVQRMFGERAPDLQNRHEYEDDGFRQVQEAVLSGNISTVVPIEIARRYGHSHVREELLLKTKVNEEEGYVYWHDLRLMQLEIPWLKQIAWVKRFKLARNGFKTLPPEMATYLKQVVKIDLQQNDLKTIPKCLLELPSLEELNLSSNKLMEIPDVAEWSPLLTVLDLSNNQLQNLPLNVVAPAIRSLNLANNFFCNVPLCICSFTTLHSLNLSDNSDILTLPAEMGRLHFLAYLNLNGLKHLKDPPKKLQMDCRDSIGYLNWKLCNPRGFYHMKLMLVGYANRGKTTLVARLQGKEYVEESTVAVDISEWWYRPSNGRRVFHFSIWDFGGQEEYYATYQCFLSQHTLYLLLFNLLHGDKGVEELRPWLNDLAHRVPRSYVIIIGTHLDEVEDDKRGEIAALLDRVGTLAASYNNKLQIVEVFAIGLKNRIENIGLLKEAIYNHASGYKNRAGQLIMGQKIPAGYHALHEQLKTVQHEVRQGIRKPIMHSEEFRTMVHQMNLADIQDDDELKTATLFLTDVGSILHYDDRGHSLHELYFVDPQWLYDMMSKVVRNPFVKSGILYSKDFPMLFEGKLFPWQYFEQFIALLDKFEIALPLDMRRLLIPSMLPESKQTEFEDESPGSKVLVNFRFIMFRSTNTPPGFWSRLLSRIMHSVPKVCSALDKSMPTTVKGTPFPANDPPTKAELNLSISTSIHPDNPTSFDDDVSIGTEASVDVFGLSPGPISPDAQVPDGTNFLTSLANTDVSGQSFTTSPQLLPHFPKKLPNDLTDSFDAKEIHLEYWHTGLCYKDPEIMFRVKSLLESKYFQEELKDGILLTTCANNAGKKMICELVDLVVSLVNEWYPRLLGDNDNGLEQKVLCIECIKQGRLKPYAFQVEQCQAVIKMNEMTMECGYFHDDPARNHTVLLTDIVPDLLLQDIDPEFHLSSEEIICKGRYYHLIGRVGYGDICFARCKGKSVAIKEYHSHYTELCSEARILAQLSHPCIVRLVGVCMHQPVGLVVEEAPLKSIDLLLLRSKVPVHRVTIYRIAAEVASGLQFLHSRGIILRDVKAANTLLWTLDPDSLCHCKLTDFEIATYLSPIGTIGFMGTRGFIAPEVLYFSKRKQHSVYDYRADIFSYGMFLYQLIARRHPYYNTSPYRINAAVKSGERPKLEDVNVSRTGYHYLTQIMKCCWEDNPNHRPDTETIIKKVCMTPCQMTMCVAPIRNRRSLYQATAITYSMFAKARPLNRLQSELWVCCSDDKCAEISMLNIHSMMDVNSVFIKDSHVQCMALCGHYVWIGSQAGIIDILSINSREIVKSIQICENSQTITCITATDKNVYLGTLKGCCLSFNNDVSTVQTNTRQLPSKHAIDGIVCTLQCVWVTQMRCIYFLNFDDLALQGSLHREEIYCNIGQLSFDQDNDIVWSAHIDGVILSAWDAHNKSHMYDVDTGKHLKRIGTDCEDPVITAMTSALDTVWVGMASGHIMVFHEDELLSWFHPYEEYVRFLTCIPSSGPCGLEEAMVASGGKGYIPLFEDPENISNRYEHSGKDYGETVIIWEAYHARRLRQVKLIEENSPGYLDNYDTACELIRKGGFRDGTHILPTSSETDRQESEENIVSVDHVPLGDEVLQDSMETSENLEHSDEEDEDNIIITNPAIAKISETRLSEEELKVQFLNSDDQCFIITCAKPVQLDSVMNEIQLSANLDSQLFHLFYSCGDSELIVIHSHEDFERYLAIPNASRPTLMVETNQSIEEETKGGVLHPNLLEDLSFTPRSQSDVDMVQEAVPCEVASVETENEEHLQGDILDDHITQETENEFHLHSDVLDDQNVTQTGMQRTDDERVEMAASSSDKNRGLATPLPLPLLIEETSDDNERRVGVIKREGKPTIQQLQKIEGKDKVIRIMTTVAPEWEELAISMGTKAHIISTIRRDNLQDSKGATRQLFIGWLEGKTVSCTWEGLVQCLDDAGFSGIASEIQEMF